MGETTSLTPLYHFHPLHKHSDIIWAITGESSPLHTASIRTRTANFKFPSASRSTKLRALNEWFQSKQLKHQTEAVAHICLTQNQLQSRKLSPDEVKK